MMVRWCVAAEGVGGRGGDSPGKPEPDFICFLPARRYWHDARLARGEQTATTVRGKEPESVSNTLRGGPIAAQTTGDRKEKSDDHKEDLRQKPHDRRRQSTYLHAVPERRCPSMAGS